MAAATALVSRGFGLRAPLERAAWVRNGVWSLFEQGLGSCANQIISIVVARTISPDGYGAFTLAFSILLMIAVLYYALIVEPMMVFGSGKYSQCFNEYLLVLEYGHWILTGSLTALLAIVALFFSHLGNLTMAAAFTGAAIALPFNLYLLLLRPACYVRDRVRTALLGSSLNLLLSGAGLAVLYTAGGLSTLGAFVVIAFAAAAASVVIRLALTKRGQPKASAVDRLSRPVPTIPGVVRDHYSFGGANLLAALAFLASGQLMPLALIPAFIGLKAEAAVGVVANLFGPLNLMMRSAAVLLLPAVSRHAHAHGLDARARRYLYFAAAAFASGTALYGALLLTFGRPIMHFLYGGHYEQSSALILVFAISYVASSVEQILAIGLKAIRKVRTLVFARGTAALISPLLAMPALLSGHLPLVIAAFTLGYVIAGATIAYRMPRYDESTQQLSRAAS